jgi:hypothetical protein
MLVKHDMPLIEEIAMLGPEKKQRRAKADNGPLIAAYIRTGSVWKAATELGMCGQSVHERLVKLGMIKPLNRFSDDERQILREQYEAAADEGRLNELAATMGRTKQFLCRQARELGLTNAKRTKAYNAEKSRAAMLAWHAVHDHPRGMLGKKHTAAVGAAVAKAGRERWEAMSEDQRDALIIRQIKGRAAKNGGKLVPDEATRTTSWKQAWREIGGQRAFFRSAWEANYARYLEMLRADGKIKSWEHEPHTFWFEGIKRGSSNYLPDFKVTALDGSITWHEVKGWMDDRSKVKLARMAKYHPDVAVVVVDAAAYRKMKSIYRYVIDGWEA